MKSDNIVDCISDEDFTSSGEPYSIHIDGMVYLITYWDDQLYLSESASMVTKRHRIYLELCLGELS